MHQINLQCLIFHAAARRRGEGHWKGRWVIMADGVGLGMDLQTHLVLMLKAAPREARTPDLEVNSLTL